MVFLLLFCQLLGVSANAASVRFSGEVVSPGFSKIEINTGSIVVLGNKGGVQLKVYNGQSVEVTLSHAVFDANNKRVVSSILGGSTSLAAGASGMRIIEMSLDQKFAQPLRVCARQSLSNGQKFASNCFKVKVTQL